VPQADFMALITLQMIDGAERGRAYTELSTPVTIGREEGNTIQLNDDRVSRFHLKIQEDHEKLILTDLQSTNGTKVNGDDVQIRILRFGDMVSLGRTVLIYGSSEEIAQRLRSLREQDGGEGVSGTAEDSEFKLEDSPDESEAEGPPKERALDFELNWGSQQADNSTLHSLTPPELPSRLTPGQAAQLAEMLEYLHIRIRDLLASTTVDERESRVHLDEHQWQNLLDLQARLAVYLRHIGEPND
jgi:pSer/pThr/pTyr-binding forkhead associated (FHA) protein